MDIQTRKLNIISYLINLDDEKELLRIETEILKNHADLQIMHKPFSKDELLQRVNESLEDYRKGKFTSQEELEDESEKWI